MFRIAALPQLNPRRSGRIAPIAIAKPEVSTAVKTSHPATAEIRIRKFEEFSVNEETYTAILPHAATSPIDLMRAITEACQDLPEFQIRNVEDEQFILTLVLKS